MQSIMTGGSSTREESPNVKHERVELPIQTNVSLTRPCQTQNPRLESPRLSRQSLSDASPMPRLRSGPLLATQLTLTRFDSMLFQCFHIGMTIIPSLTFMIETEFWRNVSSHCSRWTSIMQSVLSFAATCMHFLTDDPRFSSAAILYRGFALKALQDDIRLGTQGMDATIAASILLADHAAYEGDWKASILHHRGLANFCKQNSALSTVSFFAATRSFDPALEQIQERNINVDLLRSTREGHACCTSIDELQRILACDSSRPSMSDPEFLGSPMLSRRSGARPIRFVRGGLGHLLSMICDTYVLCAQLDQSNLGFSLCLSDLETTISQLQVESNKWLAHLSQSVISDALENDPAALVLLAYKFSLDLLLHRCTLLVKRRTALLPSPAAVMAIVFIRQAYSLLTICTTDRYSTATLLLLQECMAWPLHTMAWAEQFTTPDKIQAIASSSGLLPLESLSSMPPSNYTSVQAHS